jgi:septal ring factor EnvC (AmiA/AmiB activator)
MKTLSKAFFATTLCLLTAVPVYADHPYRNDEYRERLNRIEMRIDRAVDRNELSRKDAKVLNNEYRRIHRMAKKFRDDGRLSRRERHKLDYEIERLDDQIKWYQRKNTKHHHKPKYPYGYERHDDRSGHESYHR